MTRQPNLEDVTARRKQISSDRAKLAAKDAQLRAEDDELAVAERVLKRLLESLIDTNLEALFDAPQSALELPPLSAPSRPPTVAEYILKCLQDSNQIWLTANQIKEWMDKETGRDTPLSTISPTLTSLKNDEKIVRDGLKVALTDRAEMVERYLLENAAPESEGHDSP